MTVLTMAALRETAVVYVLGARVRVRVRDSDRERSRG